MHILFIDTSLPQPDRSSADLRMFTIVKLLRELDQICHYCILYPDLFIKRNSPVAMERYKNELEKVGVIVHTKNIDKILIKNTFDIVYFKYFYPAEHTIDKIKLLQPQSKIVIDSVDIVYARLFAKAKLVNDNLSFNQAEEIKKRELSTYDKADFIVTITPEDNNILLSDSPSTKTFIIPNIHNITETCAEKKTYNPSIIFIGVFSHEPNVDAVLYFYNEIWPLLHDKHPDLIWFIVGGNVPSEIQSISNDNIFVTGYVPETQPYLNKSWISIAPLRFGAGMKGKVGEAMAAGLPVVTTDYGAQGLPIVDGKDMLIANSSEDFFKKVDNLISSASYRQFIGKNGQLFIEKYYSPEAIKNTLNNFVLRLEKKPISQRLSYSLLYRLLYRLLTILKIWVSDNIAWRLPKNYE